MLIPACFFKKIIAKAFGIFIFCLAQLLSASAFTHTDSVIMVTSPDGKVQLEVAVPNGNLYYSVKFNAAFVVMPSAISFVINKQKFGINSSLGKLHRYTINQTYTTTGVHSSAVNHFNGADIAINSLNSFTLQVRVFNDGVAFRYIIDKEGTSTINEDSTSFNLNPNTEVWSQSNISYYEGEYSKKRMESFKHGDVVGPPITLELPNNIGYAAITEGGLIDFAGMSLLMISNGGFVTNLAGEVKKEGKIEWPWRIIEVGKDLNTLVNADIITNVSPGYDQRIFPKGNLTSWIRPGRSVWSWLSKEQAVTLSNMKHFTDLAAALGFEYNMVDEGWSNWRDGARDHWDMMKTLVDYSAKKGVKIWVWKAYPDRKGIEGINTPGKRDAFFKKCKEIGVVGLKIDFFDSESQKIINFYQDALEDAARYQLMMNFHGANKPTGENRTWPNELTREGIRGLENSPPWAKGNTTLPFTRFLAGPADFTPVSFDDFLGEVSWAHQVATMIVFTSPLMCLGADPQSVLENPCKDIIQDIPVTWDETIVLPQCKIGELVLFARRKGDTWYLAGLNGKYKPVTAEVDLSFLKKGDYMLSELMDDLKTQTNVLQRSTMISANGSIKILMNGYGGYVSRICKK